jgi:hypothetical protein
MRTLGYHATRRHATSESFRGQNSRPRMVCLGGVELLGEAVVAACAFPSRRRKADWRSTQKLGAQKSPTGSPPARVPRECQVCGAIVAAIERADPSISKQFTNPVW